MRERVRERMREEAGMEGKVKPFLVCFLGVEFVFFTFVAMIKKA